MLQKKKKRINALDLYFKKHLNPYYQLFKFFPLCVYRRQIFRYRRRRELKFSRRPYIYRAKLLRFINNPIRRRKRKKKKKYIKLLRWLYKNNWKKKFFKKLKILQKTFMQYYGQMSMYNFRQINIYYRIYNNLTKFEKFFYYFEFRLPAIIVRIKFVKNYYQSVKFVLYGGLCVNGFKITYINFLVYLYDLLELSYRFYRYVFSKRYLKNRYYVKRTKRRAVFLRYYKRYVRRVYLRKKRTFLLRQINRFFEKNRRIVSAIIVRSFYKYKHRKFSKYFNFKNLSVLMSFTT
jgi:ribosomal protein S4